MTQITFPYPFSGLPAPTLPPTTPAALDVVRAIEERVLAAPQVEIETYHVLHAGVYSRTIMIPAGVVLTGALTKIPTTLTISGDVLVLLGDADQIHIAGYHVLAAAAGRKQAFIARADTWVTMSFKTAARTVEEAEAEFTDEHEHLMSRTGRNETTIGVLP